MSSEENPIPEQAQNEAPEAEQAAESVVETSEPGAEQVDEAPEAEAAADPQDLIDAEVTAAREEVLRAQAEVQNIRRRAEKDVENARRYALEKFASELLPVVDNLERTLDASNQEVSMESLLEGVELTRKSFVDVLGRFQLEQIDPVGEPFDPQYHEAMSMVPNPDAEPNSVLHVVQKGYTLNGRVIRAAMVVVAAA